MKSAVCLAGVLLLSCAGTSLAQSPFDGTWKADQSKTKLENTKPIGQYLGQGQFRCDFCTPVYTIKADGTDQPVPKQGFDTLSVKEIDAKTVAVVAKKNQKVVFDGIDTISADNKTLTWKVVNYPPNSDKPSHWIITAKRVGIAPSGAHALSGQWLEVSDTTSDSEALLCTFKTIGDELTITRPDSKPYTAKLDGNEYPVKDFDWFDTVSLKRLGERSFEETNKLKGKVVQTSTLTVSNDGKTLTIVAVETPSGRKSTWVNTKVPERAAGM